MLKKLLYDFEEYFFVFFIGAALYSFIEVLFRGYTHWTMALTGGVAFTFLYAINFIFEKQHLIIKCLAGALIITLLEFSVGCIVNLKFNMHVWDYSNMRFNLLGQICPQVTLAWFFLCIPAFSFSNLIKQKAINRR